VSAGPETLDPAEAGCQLYLLSPPRLDPDAFAAELDAALVAGGIAGFLLHLPEADADAVARAAAALLPVCRGRGVACFLADDVEAALALGADGVHLLAPEDTAAARARLGAERILGASCGGSRHVAMEAGEAGADYVAFGEPDGAVDEALLEMVAWWSELFVLPQLALGRIDAAAVGSLVRAGADFLGAGEVVWRHPGGPRAGVEMLRDATLRA